MPFVLALVNLLALAFAVVMLTSLTRRYRLVFLTAMLFPMVIWFGIALVSFPGAAWGFTEVFMMLLRGSLLLGVFSGALACYIVTQFKK